MWISYPHTKQHTFTSTRQQLPHNTHHTVNILSNPVLQNLEHNHNAKINIHSSFLALFLVDFIYSWDAVVNRIVIEIVVAVKYYLFLVSLFNLISYFLFFLYSCDCPTCFLAYVIPPGVVDDDDDDMPMIVTQQRRCKLKRHPSQ